MIAATTISQIFSTKGGKMRCRFALSVVGGIVLAFGQAAAQAKDFNKLLEGEYIVTGSSSCINGGNGFNANLSPNSPSPGHPVFVQMFNIQGARTFNGDGTGSSAGRNISIQAPNFTPQFSPTQPAIFFPGGAGASEFTGSFTYEVHPDLTITIVQGPLNGMNTAGGSAGQPFSVTGIPVFEGRISEDLQTVNIAHVVPGIEVFSQGGVNRDRICYRERTLTRVKRGG